MSILKRKNKKFDYQPRYYKGEGNPYAIKHKFDEFRSSTGANTSLKGKIKENTINAFNAGCDLVLHCNAKENEMEIVAQNSPFISKFVIKKTSQFYKILS